MKQKIGLNKNLLKAIQKLIKEAQISPAPAQPIVKPITKPSPVTRPLKIPKQWPTTAPQPTPKANQEPTIAQKHGFLTLEREWKLMKETERMKQLLLMETPMDIEPSHLGAPHQDIKSGLAGHSLTAFNIVDLLNKKVLDKSTLEKLGEEDYNAIVKYIKDNNIKVYDNPMEQVNTANIIMRLEAPHRSKLENLALNIVKQKFGLPDEIMNMIQAKLTNNMHSEAASEDNVEQDIQKTLDNFTPEEQKIIKKHIDKRIIHNALMMGAGFRAHQVFSELKSNLDAIDNKLYPLYKSFMKNVELFMWKVSPKMLAGQRMSGGKSSLDIQNGELKGAKAEAIMFPILLHEVAKSAVEILFAQNIIDVHDKHGEKVSKAVMKHSESYYNEHWMKLIGPRLWKYLHDAIDFVVKEHGNDYTIVAYVLNRMATMEPDEFLTLIDDVIYKGDVAIQKIKKIIDEVQGDIENFERQNQIVPTPEELNNDEEDHSDEIERLIRSQRPNLEAGIQNKKKSAQPSNLESMNVIELTDALQDAIENEDYALAARIRDVINSK